MTIGRRAPTLGFGLSAATAPVSPKTQGLPSPTAQLGPGWEYITRGEVNDANVVSCHRSSCR